MEITIANTDSNKLAIYEALKVPEFWIYSGKTRALSFYILQGDRYRSVKVSPTFPMLQPTALQAFAEECQRVGEATAKRQFRARVRSGLTND